MFVFSIATNEQCLKATVSLMRFEQMGKKFYSIAVFENQENIAVRGVAQLSNVCDKQLSDMTASKERLPLLITEHLQPEVCSQ